MTAHEYFRRLAQQAMENHRLSEWALAKRIGCGHGTVGHLLSEETVRLTQNQVYSLMALAHKKEDKHV